MLDGRPLKLPESGSRTTVFWPTLCSTPEFMPKCSRGLKKCVCMCVCARACMHVQMLPFLHGQGPTWLLAHLLRSIPISTSLLPFPARESPALAVLRHSIFLNKGQAGSHSCVLAHTDTLTTLDYPLLRKPSFIPPLIEVISPAFVHTCTLFPLLQPPQSYNYISVFPPGRRALGLGTALQMFKNVCVPACVHVCVYV